jgi:hypothetical protein
MKSFKFELGENDDYNYLIIIPMDSVSKKNVEKFFLIYFSIYINILIKIYFSIISHFFICNSDVF